jgi:hypothetical protein
MVNKLIQWLDLAQENRLLTPEERGLRSDLKNRVLGLTTIDPEEGKHLDLYGSKGMLVLKFSTSRQTEGKGEIS